MTHRLTPKRKLDDVLVFRDTDPDHADWPHPRYRAGAGKEVASAVRVEDVKLADYRRDELKRLAAAESRKLESERRLNLTGEEVDAAIDRLEQAVRTEIERTIAGRRIAVPDYYVHRIGRRAVQPHEEALAGQYGLFIRGGIAVNNRPTFANGKIIGLFAGAPLKSKAEREAHIKAVGGATDFDQYAVDIAKSYEGPAVVISPMRGGNSMAFANTATAAEAARTRDPQYDHRRINAILVSLDVTMIDKDRMSHKEQVAAIVGLDNLHHQVYLDYGKNYLQHFRARPEHSRSSQRVAKRTRGQREAEMPENTDIMVDNPAKRRRLEDRDRRRMRGR